ncbi:MAG: ATPase P [Anaerolineae bacterium]|nr:ATPase P [Anaerolineae bacterium]
MDVNIPGVGSFHLHNVVFDLNGTLALDGKIPADVKRRIRDLSKQCRVVITSSDIHTTLASLAEELGVEYHVLRGDEVAPQKAALVRALGASQTIAVGNGSSDWQMLREAAVGIVVVGTEGASVKAAANADILVTCAVDAIDCILNPLRLVATLRG